MTSFEGMYQAGFRQLLPLRAGEKIPAQKGWTVAGDVTVEDARKWDAAAARYNVGMLARDYPAVDIDCDDVNMTFRIVNMARATLGPAPARARNARALLMYKTAKSFKKMKLTLSHASRASFDVEILGDGQQYLVAGATPAGGYSWFPAELDAGTLTEVTKDDVSAFLEQLTATLSVEGWTAVVRRGSERENAPQQASLRAPSIEALRTLVMSIPNDTDYDEWVQFLSAITGAGSADPVAATEIAVDWSVTHVSASTEPLETTMKMQSFGEVTLGWHWLKDQAKAGGVDTAPDFTPVDEPTPLENPFDIEGYLTFSDQWSFAMVLPVLRDNLRYASGAWFIWADNRWLLDTKEKHQVMVGEALRAVSMRVAAYARTIGDDKQAKAVRASAMALQNERKLNTVLSLVAPALACDRDDFDADTMLLGTPGGTLDLTTGSLRDSVAKDMISKSTTVTPCAGPMPVFSKFMDHFTAGDDGTRRFLQQYAGYALTGRMGEKAFIYGHGSDSDTGKSTLIHILAGVMGEYHATVDIDAFLNTNSGNAGYALAQLPGARLVTATEPKRGQSWNEKTIKTITGGDTFQARAIYGKPFMFSPQFKLLIAGNAEPTMGQVDDAMQRRCIIVPMNEKVSEVDRVHDLAGIVVRDEGPAVLQWMLDGTASWLEHGLVRPERVVTATVDYVKGEDAVGEWLEWLDEQRRGRLDDTAFAASVSLFNSWKQFRNARNEEVGPMRYLIGSLKDMGHECVTRSVGGKRSRGVIGIDLTTEIDTPEGI